jgi:tetratricopeptide (TPR) repeat protein
MGKIAGRSRWGTMPPGLNGRTAATGRRCEGWRAHWWPAVLGDDDRLRASGEQGGDLVELRRRCQHAERQALALMDHLNIAKVLDAGQTSSGRPYFVMDLVKGLPITEFCDQNRLTTNERLELFVSVCRAVQHADYSKAIALHPKLAPFWMNRGFTYNRLHQHEKALADLNKAIELDPKYATAWNNRGLVYKQLHQYDKSIADYSKAIELDPKLVVAWNNRGLDSLAKRASCCRPWKNSSSEECCSAGDVRSVPSPPETIAPAFRSRFGSR